MLSFYIFKYYSTAHRGKVHKAGGGPSHPSLIEDELNYVPFKGWAEMIRKVYEVDPLCCASCGDQMRVISFIKEPKVIDGIIASFKLSFEAELPSPPYITQHELKVAAEESGEYI